SASLDESHNAGCCSGWMSKAGCYAPGDASCGVCPDRYRATPWNAMQPGSRRSPGSTQACSSDAIIVTHPDHFGSIPLLNRLIPLRRFYDRGVPDVLTENPEQFRPLREAYPQVTGGRSQALAAGEIVPLKTAKGDEPVRLQVMAANQKFVSSKSAP